MCVGAIDSSRNYVINVTARAHERCGWQKRQEIACGSAESMATGPSPSTASTEINLAQQAIQLLRQSQGQSGTDRKTIDKQGRQALVSIAGSCVC